MMRGIAVVVCGVLLLHAGKALAVDAVEAQGAPQAADEADKMRACDALRGRGVGSTENFPPYRVELQMFECAGMTQDVAGLDAMDRDIMVFRAKVNTLEVLREQKTHDETPRKYSEVTTAARLAKLKQLVDAYYKY